MVSSNYRQVFKSAIARIYHTNGVVVGAGFLVANGQLLTCAHVVTAALGLSTTTQEAPTDTLLLDFPFIAPGQKVKATVVFWRPVQLEPFNSLEIGEDIAGLALESSPSDDCQPVRLVSADDLWEHPFQIFGFPNQRDEGIWASGVIRDRLANGWVQIEDIKAQGHPVQPGFSGAPIWDEQVEGVVGMAVAADKKREETRTAFMIPTRILCNAWNEVSQLPQTIAEYRVEAEIFIYSSCARSAKIDSRCEDTLELLRKRLNLSKEETISIENEIICHFQSACIKICRDVHKSEIQIGTIFQDKGSSNYFAVQEREVLEERLAAIGIDPKAAGLTLAWLGDNSREAGNLEKATKLYNQAIAYNSNNHRAYQGLGAIHLKKDNFTDALKCFRQLKDLYKEEKGKAKQVEEVEKLIQLAERMKRRSLLLKFSRFILRIPFTSILESVWVFCSQCVTRFCEILKGFP